MVFGGVVIARDASGLATAFSTTKNAWLSKLNNYCGQWTLLLEMHGTKNWGFLVIPDGEPIESAALSDPDIIFTPSSWTLNTIITGAAYITISNAIARTDLTPAFFNGMTFREMIAALAVSLGSNTISDDVFT